MKTRAFQSGLKPELQTTVRRRARRIRRLLQEAAAARPTFYPARHA